MSSLTGGARLMKLLKMYPYLDLVEHQLHELVKAVRQGVAAGEDVEDLLDQIESLNEAEQQTLAAAFKRFDHRHTSELSTKELKLMSEYLGFPSSDADVANLLKAIDTDGSGMVSFEEFNNYVGKLGGTMKLFEARRARLSDRMRSSSTSGDLKIEDLAASLMEAGIDKEAQVSWKLVLPPSDFNAVGELVKPQKDALRHIRRLSKQNHQKALQPLQQRVAKLGHTDNDLWMTLAWIRELAPLLVHVNLDKMLPFMEGDTHYRNQFETGKSGGLLNTEVRKKWEKDLFGGTYDKAAGKERPKYGVQNVMNDYRGVVKCAQYGDSYLILKDVRLRCTFAPEDSANLKAEKLAVLDFYGHVLNEYSDAELKETLKVANSKEAAVIGDSDKVGKMKYKEAQIHGDVAFGQHVERVVANERHRSTPQGQKIKDVAKKYGWAFSWMDEEQKRMQKEDMHKMGGDAWTERLKLLQESDGGGDEDVPEGFCKKGCGRAVAPGVTRAGRPYITCCRGCTMGFGHDLLCGAIDPSKVGPGLCKMGCGQPLAPGTDSKGRGLTTCCRGCAMGLGHDAYCGKDPAASASMGSRRCERVSSSGSVGGTCKTGCGRSVAPGTTRSGKSFDTCCRGCATGSAHIDECAARAKAEGRP